MNSVLVTGGSGFFGTAFVKAALAKGVKRVCVFSRGEYRQAQMRAEIGDDERVRYFIGDVRDKDRLTRAMEGVEVVVHAAALKRVEVIEYNVLEAVSTNVLGTENVVKAAIDAGVKKAVLISSDKAVEPLNAYGITKALAEKVFLSAKHYAGADGPRFAVVRYGNVASSTGSVIPMWRWAIDNGADEVPVTHPDCTRYWMYREDAVALVMRTIAEMKGGEINIPELPAYRLGDLAEAMGTSMKVIGLRDGEKMHERMTLAETSEQARRMSVEELREALARV